MAFYHINTLELLTTYRSVTSVYLLVYSKRVPTRGTFLFLPCLPSPSFLP